MSDVVPARRRSSASESETLSVSAPSTTSHVSTTPVGTSVARYVVLEEVGRGGMGRVLRAYDPKLQREVALKEVHARRLDAEATSRLVAEARAMAKLSHPNVVAVYDVEEVPELPSEASGRMGGRGGEVILVMEYVAGQTLKGWLQAEQHTWRAIVHCFLGAGRGLAAAHEAGMLHRDFKPANVLVAADGPVKVTDFGLAKAGPSASESSSLDEEASSEELTETGTPRYMAPEQHRPGRSRSGVNNGPLTAAADQYAFCVALWEALCGKPPFAGKEMEAHKRQGPPPWTETRVPKPIALAVMRGLSPRPADRWPSMEALLQALAWDPSRRRNRVLLGLVGLGALSMAGVSYHVWAQARAQRCSGAERQLVGVWDEAQEDAVRTAMLGVDRPYARHAWERTQAQLQQYAREWAAMHTEACEATTVRGEQSPQMMDLRMGCLHRAAVELGATIEVLADADETVVQKAQELTGGLPSLSRCADTEALAADVEPPQPAEAQDVEAARAHLAQARTLSKAGRYEAATRAVEEAQVLLQGVEYGPVQTEVALARGDVLEKLGAYEASEAALDSALTQAAAWRQWDAMRAAATKLLFVVGGRQQRMEESLRYRPLAEGLSRADPKSEASFRNNLASVLRVQGKYPEAEAGHRAALALWEASLAPDHPRIATSRNNLANVLRVQGKYAEAEAEHRAALALREKALGADHPHVASSRNNLANVLREQGKYPEAEAEHRAALALREKALGADHPDIATSLNNLAIALHVQGKYPEAEAGYLAALALQEKALGPDHLHCASSRSNLAIVLQAQGKYPEAEAENRAALALREKTLGPDHPYVAQSRDNLALVLHAQGKYTEAEAEHRAALALREKALGADHPDVAASRNNLANVLRKQGKYPEAEAEHRAALALREKTLGADHPDVAQSRNNLARVLVALDRPAEALPLAEQAWARRQGDDIPTERRGETAFVLARILWVVARAPERSEGRIESAPARDRTRARQLAHDALDAYREAGEVDQTHEVQQWLDTHAGP